MRIEELKKLPADLFTLISIREESQAYSKQQNYGIERLTVEERDLARSSMRKMARIRKLPTGQKSLLKSCRQNNCEGKKNPPFVEYLKGYPPFGEYLKGNPPQVATSVEALIPYYNGLPELPEDYHAAYRVMHGDMRNKATAAGMKKSANLERRLSGGASSARKPPKKNR